MREAVDSDLGRCLASGRWRRDASMDANSSSASASSTTQQQGGATSTNLWRAPSGYGASCQWLRDTYRCSGRHAAAQQRFAYEVPGSCALQTLEAAGIGRADDGCLGGKRLALVGDSLVHQLLHSLECRLAAHVTQRQLLATYTLGESDVHEKHVRVVFDNGMEVEFYFVGNDQREHPLQSSSQPADFWKFADRNADVLVTNLGVFHLTDLEYQREERTSKVLAHGKEFLSAFAPHQVVLLGASAKHVSGWGDYTCGLDNVTVAGLETWASAQIEGLISHKNKALHWLAKRRGFHFVDQEAVTAIRVDAHVSPRDCSHYCQPGIPDLWLDMLVTQLCTTA